MRGLLTGVGLAGLLVMGCGASTPPTPPTPPRSAEPSGGSPLSPSATPGSSVLPLATVEDPNPLRSEPPAPPVPTTAAAAATDRNGGRRDTGVSGGTPSPTANAGPPRRVAPPTPTIGPAPPRDRGFKSADLLADPDWLEQNLADPHLRILDARSPEAFAAGHLPGAINLGPQWLIDLGGKVPPTLLGPDGFAAEMASDGISQNHEVIVYDDDGGLWAARVIWALHAYGQTKAHLLEGGFRGWQTAGKPVSTTRLKPEPAKFEPRPVAAVQASASAVTAALKDPRVVIVDARSPDEYRGKLRLAARAGHIPGAVNLYWRESLRSDGQYFKSAAELESQYQQLGVTPDKTVIVYCQNGVRAAHVYLTLKLLGYPEVRLYDGSWLEWASRTDLPIETERARS